MTFNLTFTDTHGTQWKCANTTVEQQGAPTQAGVNTANPTKISCDTWEQTGQTGQTSYTGGEGLRIALQEMTKNGVHFGRCASPDCQLYRDSSDASKVHLITPKGTVEIEDVPEEGTLLVPLQTGDLRLDLATIEAN